MSSLEEEKCNSYSFVYKEKETKSAGESKILNQLNSYEKSKFKGKNQMMSHDSIYGELWSEHPDPARKFDEDTESPPDTKSTSFILSGSKPHRKLSENQSDKFFNKPWNIYLKSQLESCKEANYLVDWPEKMLAVLTKIVDIDSQTNIDLKWQTDLYSSNYANNTRDKIFANNKKEFKLRNRLFSYDRPSDSVSLSHEKDKLGIKKDVLDETGFYVLDMQNDEFVQRVNRIKDHLKEPDHPLNVIMKKFDDEFWDSYGIYMCKKEQLADIIEQKLLLGIGEL